MLVIVLDCNNYMCFWLVGLSTSSGPTLFLKAPQMEDGTIYPELLLTVRVVYCNKISGCWQLKDKKNSLLKINNYLLKHNGVTMYTINLTKKIQFNGSIMNFFQVLKNNLHQMEFNTFMLRICFPKRLLVTLILILII